jgi:hypothetical protein
MKASASIVLLLSESYSMASPTPILSGKPPSNVAVDPEIVNSLQLQHLMNSDRHANTTIAGATQVNAPGFPRRR